MRSAVLLAIAVCFAAPAAAAPPFEIVVDAPLLPAGAFRYVIRSPTLGHDVEVIVQAPPDPQVGKLPAIYALDGGYAIAGPIAHMMMQQDLMASAYVVSIGYPAGQDHRDTDLLHRTAPEVKGDIGGGGAKFETFLTRELRPWLEDRYRLDPRRAVLFGHSFGGLFALNVLASDPEPWSGFIIASPSTLRDPELMLDLPAVAKKAAGKRAYVAVGGAELAQMIAGAEKAASVLKAEGLTVEYRSFPGQAHIAYYPELVPAAFAWMFPLRR
jgi:predicted alpha/beta superfamily hydrolase